MPLQATSGAASYDAFGGGVAAVPQYIEDVFSTYLFNTSASNQNIINGINLATYGGLTWIKSRSNVFDHVLQTSAGSVYNALSSNSTSAALSGYYRIADLSNGFTFGTDYYTGTVQTTCSWTFRKQPKFFDIVTYTGNGADPRAISHNLGSAPGCVIIKCTSNTTNWSVFHIYDGSGIVLNLNRSAVTGTTTGGYCNQASSTTFTVNAQGGGTSGIENVNASGYTYVAYLFAHNAGGFGLTGTDNVISCGSYTGNGATGGQLINLGYEAQWVMIKQTNAANDWWMMDTMRGWIVNGDFGADKALFANASAQEQNQVMGQPSAQGFTPIQDNVNQSGQSYIYIAIRRGPMKVPTDATKVFSPVARNGTGATAVITTPGFPPDMTLVRNSNNYADSSNFVNDRLRGNLAYLKTQQTSAEASNYTTQILSFDMLGFTLGADQANGGMNYSAAATYINYFFQRAPSFFDEVCYTGNGSSQFINHNLGVFPQLVIAKSRSATANWAVRYTSDPSYTQDMFLGLNSTSANPFTSIGGQVLGYSTTQIYATDAYGSVTSSNANGVTYVAYLFASCPGVSKISTYTGNGTTQTIDCGFTGGARFVLIKRTDSTGDWYVYDTARGMTTLTDPYLALNTTTADTATLGSVTTVSTGFALNSAILAAINVNGGTYLFLAIA